MSDETNEQPDEATAPEAERAPELLALSTEVAEVAETGETTDAIEAAPHATDAAVDSLSDALGVGFSVLKWVMILLLGTFFLSGTFNVAQQEVAVHLRFGRVLGAPGEQVLEPGGPYLALPEPVDRVVRIPTVEQTVDIDRAFMQKPPDAGTRNDPDAGLDPKKDGFLLTADRNIVHGRWSVRFSVNPAGAVAFARSLGDMRKAHAVVRLAAERAIVAATAETKADTFVAGGLRESRLLDLIQKSLNRLGTGITVSQVNNKEYIAPKALADAFQQVTSAETARVTTIQKARGKSTAILIQVAGRAHAELMDAIHRYERARGTGAEESEAARRADTAVTTMLESEAVQGSAGRAIADARAYRESRAESVKGDVEAFLGKLQAYRANPEIEKSRLWQEAKAAILGGDVEKIYLPPGDDKTIYLELNPDPQIRRRREAEIYRDLKRKISGKDK
jgi:regulator of protease activity HflC (stomatin/prohibitin superfamily)